MVCLGLKPGAGECVVFRFVNVGVTRNSAMNDLEPLSSNFFRVE